MTTSYKATLDAPPEQIGDQHTLLVRIWDLGPQKPEVPVKPDLPEGKEGTPAYDLAVIDFEGALARYKSGLAAYGQQQKDFVEWHQHYQGPYQFETHSVNAREAIANDPQRYVAELPKGRKPGKWHADQVEQAAERRRDFARTIARDPVFGSQGASL